MMCAVGKRCFEIYRGPDRMLMLGMLRFAFLADFFEGGSLNFLG